jgi:hypothetical protein
MWVKWLECATFNAYQWLSRNNQPTFYYGHSLIPPIFNSSSIHSITIQYPKRHQKNYKLHSI